MFCWGCLNKYFPPNFGTKPCPLCQQAGLSKSNIKWSAFASRLVKSLQIKCKLQHQQQPNANNPIQHLQQHIQNNCPLYTIICQHCNKSVKRHELTAHNCLKEEMRINWIKKV